MFSITTFVIFFDAEKLKGEVLPDGPPALSHPTNEDLFAGPDSAGVRTPFYCFAWSSRWSESSSLATNGSANQGGIQVTK
jgi:hypothetical protein